MATSPGSLPSHDDTLRHASCGFIHQPTECSTSEIFLSVLDADGRGHQPPSLSMASQSVLCLPSNTPHSEGNQENLGGGGRSASRGTALAATSMVCRSSDAVHHRSLVDSSSSDLPQPGGGATSRHPVASVGRLALEREILKKAHFSSKVNDTMLASRQASTNRIYDATWTFFCHWCQREKLIPTLASVPHTLDFLQRGLDKRLSASTLHRQVAALATVLPGEGSISLSQHPRVQFFLKKGRQPLAAICPSLSFL